MVGRFVDMIQGGTRDAGKKERKSQLYRTHKSFAPPDKQQNQPHRTQRKVLKKKYNKKEKLERGKLCSLDYSFNPVAFQ